MYRFVLGACLIAAAPFASGCSSDSTALQLDVNTGQEKGAFTADPPVKRVEITARATDGTGTLIASVAPGSPFDLGEVPLDEHFTFEVAGLDAQSNTVMRGRSIGALPVGSITGTLQVFVERVNTWGRPLGALQHTHLGGTAGILGERSLLLTGGTALDSMGMPADAFGGDYYDLFAFAGGTIDGFPRAAETVVSRTDVILLVDPTGAVIVDQGTGSATEMALPAGLSAFADVSGGRVLDSDDGRTFLIGAARKGKPTKAVLVVNADGTYSGLNLTAERAGAAVEWVAGVGLVVAGGSPTAPGVELLTPTGTGFTALAFDPDPVAGAGAAISDVSGKQVVLVGGVTPDGKPAPTRQLDPACPAKCVPTTIDAAVVPVALAGVSAYTFGKGKIIAVGDETAASAMTRSFVVDLAGSSTELAFREPRKKASAIPSPNGTLAVVGGAHADGTPALSVEMFFPQ